MKYPTPGDYQEALQFPETAFRDEALRQGTPEQNVLGLPKGITGAFAAVFPVETRAGRWAVKCFLTEVPEQHKRYRAIRRALQEADLPFTVPFDYQPEGVQVGTRALPLLKMKWTAGVPLNRFVAQHREAPDVLAALAERWAALLRALDEAGLAHGDLQHGNVLVQEDADALSLKLVDYDTMYVPALKGKKSAEIGHRNYQHPDRDEADFGPHLDRFAGLVVFTALHACRLRPALWARFDTGENLLFRAADFYDPPASVLFGELEGLDELTPLVEALRTACYLEPEAMLPLSDVQAGALSEVRANGASARRRRARARRHAPPRTRLERGFLPAAVALALAVGVLVGFGQFVAAGVILLIGAVLLGGAAARGYRQVPLARRHRRLRQETARLTQALAALDRQIADLGDRRRAAQATREEQRAEQLRALQEQALYDRLKYHFIGEAGAVEGVTHKVVVRLKASGIRTAHQATPERLRPIRQLGDAAKTRVAQWRAALVRQYEDEVPETLSPAEARQVERAVERRVEHFERERARAQEKKVVQEEERAQVEARRAGLPLLSFGRYLRVLLRLDALPPLERAPTPTPVPPPGDVLPDETAPLPEPEPSSAEAAWWAQRRT